MAHFHKTRVGTQRYIEAQKASLVQALRFGTLSPRLNGRCSKCTGMREFSDADLSPRLVASDYKRDSRSGKLIERAFAWHGRVLQCLTLCSRERRKQQIDYTL